MMEQSFDKYLAGTDFIAQAQAMGGGQKLKPTSNSRAIEVANDAVGELLHSICSERLIILSSVCHCHRLPFTAMAGG